MDLYEQLACAVYVLMPAFAVCVFLYVRAEGRDDGAAAFRKACALKAACSCLFAATGVVSYAMSLESYAIRPDIYFQAQLLVVVGLFFCLPGDLLLQYIRLDEKKYKAGIACFLAAQALFFASLALMNLLVGWPQTILVAVGLIVLVLAFMTRQKWKLGSEKGLITAYTIVLSFVVAKAVANAFYDRTLGSVFMCAGAALIFASDVILGVWNYGGGGRGCTAANRIAYFAGAMLVALSVNPLFDVSLGPAATFA